MLKINKKISAYNHYDYNNPKFISIHYVGAQSSTAANNATYFFTGDRQASAHYFVDDNEIWQSVEDNNGSWAVGNTRTEVHNQNSIAVEMCCFGANLEVTEKTEANTIELVKHLMKKYNITIENVRTHYEITRGTKVCPNWSANNWARWKEFKKKLVAEPKWVESDKGWWYDLGDGTYSTNKWLEIKGEWYYFDEKGYAYKNKWLKHKDSWYWFDKDCKMVKECVLKINNKYYAFDTAGKMKTNLAVNEKGQIVL